MTPKENRAAEGRKCFYCGASDRELRPYGPGGMDTCFSCMKDPRHPEREKVAMRQFDSLCGMAASQGQGAVMIGTDDGPLPFDPTGKNQA